MISVFIRMRGVAGRRRLFYGDKIKWFIFSYVLVLFLSALLFTVFLEKETMGQSDFGGEDLQITTTYFNEAYEILNAKVKQHERWDFDGSELTLTTPQFLSVPVFVEWKETNDQTVEAIYYIGRSTTYNSFFDYFPPYSFELTDGVLSIEQPEMIDLKFATFSEGFTVSQFTGREWFGGLTEDMIGERAIYLSIPKQLKLKYGDEVDVRFIKEFNRIPR